MAPIPVHTASPINTSAPLHAFGTSPSTAAARYTPTDPEARPTSTEPLGASPSQLPAQPGASAVPRPTNAAASTYNNRLEPTATTSLPSGDSVAARSTPPPPQPGAVPSPFGSPSLRAFVPAPPQPLDIPQATQFGSPSNSPPRQIAAPMSTQTPTHSRPMPIQSPAFYTTTFTPTRSMPPASMTSISTSPKYNYSSPAYSLPQSLPAQDLSHPPGYQQDHHSSFDDKPVEACVETDYRATLSPLSASRKGAGILDMEWTFGGSPSGSNNGDSTVVKTAMSWAKAAGKRLSMTERQIWKSINGEDEDR